MSENENLSVPTSVPVPVPDPKLEKQKLSLKQHKSEFYVYEKKTRVSFMSMKKRHACLSVI